jgi:molybdopterin-guanine dinucleotide biosynthesis protein A
MKFSAVILAGGKSSRMGRDKAFIEVDGRPLLARQIQLASDVGADEVYVSGRAEADYAAFNCPVLRDRFINFGPLAGIEAALNVTTSQLLLVLAVDMPEMNAAFLQRLTAQCADGCGAIPRVNGFPEALAAFYPKAAVELLAEILEAPNGRSSVTGFQPVRWRSPSQAKPPSRRDIPQDRLEACPTAAERPTKSPSAKHFAERCVATGLGAFVDFPESDARFFSNWNSPADVPCLK